MQPWADKLVAEHRANDSAEISKRVAFPAVLRAPAPYHTSLFSTPKLV